MKIEIAAALAISLFSSAANSQAPACSPENYNAMREGLLATRTCVELNAKDLETSGETADLVATAAISKCERQFALAKTAATECRGATVGRKIDEKIRETLKNHAIGIVVGMRAR